MWRQLGAGLAVVLVGACGGSSTPTSPTPTPPPAPPAANRAPVIQSVSASPMYGVADLQLFAFEINVSDPDGDALSFLWNLGLDVTSPLRRPTATYGGAQSREWTITVVVSDGHGGSASGSVTIAVGSLNGLWKVGDGVLAGAGFWLLQNAAGLVVGNYGLPGAGTLEDLTDGRITLDGSVTLPLRLGSRQFTFTGTLEAPGRRVVGVLNGAGYNGAPCVLVLDLSAGSAVRPSVR